MKDLKDLKSLIKKTLLFKQTEPQEGDEAGSIIRGIFSTENKDRHDEKIVQTGWKLDEFKANPVVLFAHDQWIPAIGKVIEIEINAEGLLSGAIQFAVEEHELAKTIYNLYKGGFMRAFSVGFRNDVYVVDKENDVIILKENTLFEISCVNVPANSMALAQSKGLEVKSIEEARQKIEEKAESEVVEYMSVKIIEHLENELKFDKIKNNESNDNRDKKIKVETRHATGVKKLNCQQVNKAIRRLLKIKKNIKI